MYCGLVRNVEDFRLMAMFIIANARQLGTFDERLNAAEATSKEAMVVGNQQNIRGIIAMM